jgi:beta-galactosidase
MNYRGSVAIISPSMKSTIRTLLTSLLALATLPVFGQPAQSAATAPAHTFTIEGDHFALDGKPFKILSGELHYARIPREYWHARLKMARAMGLNTIATYVFWNVHEPTPNHFDFTGQYDVAAFIRAAQEEGLYVILRAGPYSCAEWEFGGFPAWLLKDPRMPTALRSNDPAFMVPVERWITRLAQEVAPLQISRGGPILITQVENEYGGFHAPPDPTHAYMTHMRDIFLHAGFTGSLIDTVDGGDDLAIGGIPGVYTGVNFGVGSHQRGMDALAAFQPGKPLFVSEYWPGWFDAWGHPHQTRPLQPQLEDLDYILNRGSGINLYMFHGGTSFGFMSGADLSSTSHNSYQPDVTSYDYGAPLDEAGHPTPKFLAFRKIFAKYACEGSNRSVIPNEARSAQSRAPRISPEAATNSTAEQQDQTGEASCLPPIPVPPPVITIPTITLTESTPLWANLPKPIRSDTPKTMEQFNQAYGYILYRHQLPTAVTGNLVLEELHDYAQIYLDRKLVGILDRRDVRRDKQSTLAITTTGPASLDILVENSARINFSQAMRGESKGITKSVTLAGAPLTNWQIYPLPMTTLPSFTSAPEKVSSRPKRSEVEGSASAPASPQVSLSKYPEASASRYPEASASGLSAKQKSGALAPGVCSSSECQSTPTFYRAHFTLTTTGDTFLDVRILGKGALWINGHPIGRFWNIGPQQTLYVPGPWLRVGDNQIIVFDLAPTTSRPTVVGLATPILDGPVTDTSPTRQQE